MCIIHGCAQIIHIIYSSHIQDRELLVLINAMDELDLRII